MLPAAASSHYRRLQRLQAVTVASARRAWRRMEPRGNWSRQYQEDVGPKLTALMVAAQIAAARDADSYMAEVLNELGLGEPVGPGLVRPQAFAGVAGDGRPVATLLEQSVVVAGRAYNAARTGTPEAVLSRTAPPEAAEQALTSAQAWLDMVAQTLISDATRAAESVAMTARPWIPGYVRMLNPPSCSRCAVLAGKWFKWNEGFERHERCDCKHIPAREDQADDLRTHPDQYFDSLTRAEQDRIFTNAGAQAIRDGADMTQVVNARRGMRKAQVFGREALITLEGTTRKGVAYESLVRRGGSQRVAEELAIRNTRIGPELRRIHRERAKAPRVMPETIYELANGDRDEAIRLLKAHGFIHRYQ